ncbi:MAG TPA: glycosyltransferase family 39 protein [Candidatus Saccharimonadales bacterium]|nr:glycosyltransferase family 39 protein [Candidatus Saccharimonadales bacterium]
MMAATLSKLDKLAHRVEQLPTRSFLLLMVVIGAVLRFFDIAESSIWHDEGFTMMLVRMAPNQIIARTARDVHPPLYYLLLHYWIMVFGSSETGARSLSAVFMIAAIPLAYLLVRRLWSEPAARLAALFVATGPFLIRYSQEARMYGMVAFLLLLATYILLRALESNRWVWWLAYTLTMAAAIYTHYYTIFVIAVHWIYMGVVTPRQRRTHRGLWNPRWWLSNAVIVLAFLPWLPTAYAQYTRVQSSFWIPQATVQLLPATYLEFIIYYLSLNLGPIVEIIFGIGMVAVLVWLYRRHTTKRKAWILLTSYCALGPVMVWLISFGPRPIFVDRYFVFAAIAFYCLLGIAVAELPRKRIVTITTAILLLFTVGLVDLHITVDHQMRVIGRYVNTHYRPGDEILSGEIYTFFDFSYYNHTGATVHLWSTNGVDGYSESSLIYDRASQIVVEQLSTIHPTSGKLWVVGKTGYQQYYDPKIIPKTWKPIGPEITAGYCAVQEYRVE